MNSNSFLQRQVLREIQLQRIASDCGNAVKLVKVCETDNYINIFMERQEGGTLSSFILSQKERLSEKDARVIMA